MARLLWLRACSRRGRPPLQPQATGPSHPTFRSYHQSTYGTSFRRDLLLHPPPPTHAASPSPPADPAPPASHDNLRLLDQAVRLPPTRRPQGILIHRKRNRLDRFRHHGQAQGDDGSTT